MSVISQIFTFAAWMLPALVLLALIIRAVGRWFLSRVPKGGIHKSM